MGSKKGGFLSKLNKISTKLDPIGMAIPNEVFDPILANFNLPNGSGKLSPTEQLAKDQQEAADKAAQQAAILQANANAAATNSANDNTASVISGGSADSMDGTANDLLKRRASTVSATLGI